MKQLHNSDGYCCFCQAKVDKDTGECENGHKIWDEETLRRNGRRPFAKKYWHCECGAIIER